MDHDNFDHIASKNQCDVAAGTGYKTLIKMLMITTVRDSQIDTET